MNETPFEQFIMLVQVDQNINALTASIAALEKQNSEYTNNDEIHKAKLEEVKHKLHDVRKEVEAKELEMKILDQQETEKKNRLDAIGGYKEYQSIKAEIDQLKKAQHDLEDSLMAAWNHLETIKKESEHATQIYQQQHMQLQEKTEHNQQKITELQAQIAALVTDRTQKEQGIPAEWLEKYAVMRSKVTDPVVPVVNDSCTACFYKVSAQDMQFLRRRRLVQCKDCYRLLYLPEAQEAATKGSV
jgi:predicted  nucleic acid-binding Zn-ribbon protein